MKKASTKENGVNGAGCVYPHVFRGMKNFRTMTTFGPTARHHGSDYLSGFLAEHTKEGGQNRLEVTAVPTVTPDGKAAWDSRVMVQRKDAEDEMGWGTGFLITASDRVVVRQSFRCLGGG